MKKRPVLAHIKKTHLILFRYFFPKPNDLNSRMLQNCYLVAHQRSTVRIRSSPICYIKLYRKDAKEAVNDLFTTLEERKINNCKNKLLFSETIGEQKLIFYRTMSWWVLTTSARAGRHSMSQHSISLYLIKSLRPPSFSD